MRKRVIALLVALATALGVGGFALSQASAAPATINPNPVAAGPYHSGNITCAQDGTRTFIVWDHYCPTGFHYAQIPAQDVYGSTSGTGLTQAQVQALIDTAVAKALASNPVTAPAPVTGAPTLVQDDALALTTASVPLKWSGATAPSGLTIASYLVQFQKHGTTPDWASPTSRTAASPLLTVGSLTSNTTYDFRVRAVYNNSDPGAWSNVISVTTNDQGEAAPVLTVTDKTGGQALLSWTAGSPPVGLTISSYQFVRDGGTWATVAPPTGLTHTDNPPAPVPATHIYQVRARYSDGTSGPSSVAVSVVVS